MVLPQGQDWFNVPYSRQHAQVHYSLWSCAWWGHENSY